MKLAKDHLDNSIIRARNHDSTPRGYSRGPLSCAISRRHGIAHSTLKINDSLLTNVDILAINVLLQHAPNLHPARLPLTSNASEDRHDQQPKPLVKLNDSNHTVRADCALKRGVATLTIIFVVSSHSSMLIVVRSILFEVPPSFKWLIPSVAF